MLFAESQISIENFYGIELADFATEVAILSLWIAKHQMNAEFKEKFTAFDTIHDQARPTNALTAIAEALRSDGVFFMGDIKFSSALEDNIGNPFAPSIFAFSVFHGLTVSLAYGGEGLGTAWGEQLAIDKLKEAGFSEIETKHAEDDFLNVYYVARKA